MRRALIPLLLLCVPSLAAAQPFEPDDSVLQVQATYQEYDPHQPWQKRQPDVRTGYGVVVDATHLLTTEDLVRNSTLIELRRAKSGEKFRAFVEQADYQFDVALLRIDDAASLGRLSAAVLATNVPADAEVELVQFDETGAIENGSGKILRVGVSPLPQASNPCLSFTFTTEMDVNGTGVPVAYHGGVAGLVIQYDKDSRTGLVLPYPVLKRFQDAIAKTPYPGFASAGLTWTALVDPVKRQFLGAPGNSQGVLVLSTVPGTGAADAFKPGDVILDMDGYIIDNLGYHNDPEFGRLLLPYLISGRHYPGDRINVTIIRDHKKSVVPVKLTRLMDSSSLIPENVSGEQAEYAVEGGYMIRELTGDYMLSHGPRWELQANPRLVHLYLTKAQRPSQPGERVVILSRVLPDRINLGSSHYRDEIITQINGDPVLNMRDVFRVLKRDGSLKRITLKSIGVDIVLDQDELPAANRRIARQYNIPALRYQKPVAPAVADRK